MLTPTEKRLFIIACKYYKNYDDAEPSGCWGISKETIVESIANQANISLDNNEKIKLVKSF